jgi:hypothetical protein
MPKRDERNKTGHVLRNRTAMAVAARRCSSDELRKRRNRGKNCTRPQGKRKEASKEHRERKKRRISFSFSFSSRKRRKIASNTRSNVNG